MAATIKSRVQQVLGEGSASTSLSSLNSPEKVFEEAIWRMANALPARLLMSYKLPIPPTDPANLSTDVNDDEAPSEVDILNTRVLMVMRTKAVHVMVDGAISEEKYLVRKCKDISFESSFQALDSDSIYFATDYSPVYYLAPGESNKLVLKTAPATTGFTATAGNTTLPNNSSGLQVYKYARQIISDDDSATDWDAITSFYQIPFEAEPIVVRGIALQVLDEYIAKSSFKDEDQEVMGLLVQQKQLLDQEIKSMLDQLKAEWED